MRMMMKNKKRRRKKQKQKKKKKNDRICFQSYILTTVLPGCGKASLAVYEVKGRSLSHDEEVA